MKSKLTLGEIVAVIIAFAALIGLGAMLLAEGNIMAGATPEVYQGEVLPALQKYSLAIGVIFLVVSISYILIGRSEEISTRLDDQDR